jgi:hypothetical protein
VTLALLRLAMPEQLRGLLLPHQEGTDYVRRALRNLAAERLPLVRRVQRRAQQSISFCTTAGLSEAAASGLLPAFNGSAGGRTTGRKAAAKRRRVCREHGLALVDVVLAFHAAAAADAGDWQIEAAHPTPAGPLIPDAVVLLATGRFAFVELDRGTMFYARLLAKVDRYAAYRAAPPTGRGNAARALRSHLQKHYAGHDLDRAFPPRVVVFAPVARRAASATREAEFLARAAGSQAVRFRCLVVATTTLERLTAYGPAAAVWRVAGGQDGYWTLDGLPAAR